MFNFNMYDEKDGHLEIPEGHCWIMYFPNHKLESVAQKYSLSLDELKNKMLIGTSYDVALEMIDFRYLDLGEKDLMMLFNVIYKKGLSEFYKNMELGLTSEDVNSFVADKSQNRDTSFSELWQLYRQIKASGGKLTEEQEEKLELFKRFEEYKSHSVDREDRQKHAREVVSQINAQKDEWLNNPNNPSNKRKEQLGKLLEESGKHAALLDTVRKKLMEDFLYDEQLDKLEKSSEFMRMMNEVSSIDKNSESMSDEIRNWYQEYYGGLEDSGKSK